MCSTVPIFLIRGFGGLHVKPWCIDHFVVSLLLQLKHIWAWLNNTLIPPFLSVFSCVVKAKCFKYDIHEKLYLHYCLFYRLFIIVMSGKMFIIVHLALSGVKLKNKLSI